MVILHRLMGLLVASHEHYDPITNAPIAVSYIAKKHKISITIEVFDTAGNIIIIIIDTPADGLIQVVD